MTTPCDVHVGDIGTRFQGELEDDGEPFDATLATVKTLTWKRPDGSVISRDATLTTEGVSPDERWFLEYVTLSSEPDFHALVGRYTWQGYVEFPDGKKFHTNTRAYIVSANL